MRKFYDIKGTLQLPFVKNVIHTIGSRWLTILIGLVPVILVTRGLGPEGKGQYSLVIATISVLMQLSILGLHTANTYYVSKDNNLLNKLFSNSIVWILSTVTFVSLILLLVKWLYPGEIIFISGNTIWVVIIGTYLSLSSVIFQNLGIAIHKVRIVNRSTVLAKVLTMILIVALYFSKHLTIASAVGVAILEFATLSILCLYPIWRTMAPFKFDFDLEVLKTTIKYGFRIYMATLMGFLVVRSDVYLIKYFLGAERVGFYSSAVQIIDQIQYLAIAVSSLLMPKLASLSNPQERYRLKKRSFNHIILITGAVCLGTFLFSDLIIQILFGKAFAPAALSLKILIPAVFFLSIETVLAQYIASIGLPWSLVWGWVAAFLVNIVLNMMLIPRIGETGAAIASVFSYLAILIFAWLISYRFDKKHVLV